MPDEITTLPEDSQFGMNSSSFDFPDINRKLGVKWIRFENMKWQMFCKEKGKMDFSGKVGPWYVNHDKIIQEYRDRDMKFLPYVFQTPRWATSAPEGTKKNHHGWPPNNYEDYKDAIYQLVARYSSKKVPAEKLQTTDKVSGKNQINVVELWNEPNLEGKSWAPWNGTMDDYYEIMRYGAEGAKEADPNCRTSNAGYAGISLNLVDRLHTYKYKDGKCPLDFIDIINVHYYSGRQDPETAIVDPNANRNPVKDPSKITFPEEIKRLADWRDTYAKGKEIWMTETGYDVGGPIGLGEYEQTYKVPRVTLLMLAAGIDKVFYYREKGSSPTQHGGAGLIRNDNSYRPSWFTYATLIRQFIGVKPGPAIRIAHSDPNVWIYLWNRDGKPLITAWTVEGETKLDLGFGKYDLTDSFGSKQATTKPATLSKFPIYISNIENTSKLYELAKIANNKEQQRKEQLVQQTKTKAYLYDFGSTEYVDIHYLGVPRRYTPVTSNNVFSKNTGYGFKVKSPRDEIKKWVRDPLKKDCTRLNKGNTFIISATPGNYKLEICASPFTQNTKVKINGNEIIRLTPPKPRTNTEGSANITVGETPLAISADNTIDLRWLRLTQVN